MDLERAKELNKLATKLEYLQLAQKDVHGPDIGISLYVSGRFVSSTSIDEQFYFELKKVLDDTVDRYKEMISKF